MSTMETYDITFTARLRGAIGVTHRARERVEAHTPDEARLKLYEKYEHVSDWKIERVTYDPTMAWSSYMAKLQIMEAHDYKPLCENCPAYDNSDLEDYGHARCDMARNAPLRGLILDLNEKPAIPNGGLTDDEGVVNPEWCPRRRPADWPCNAGVCDHDWTDKPTTEPKEGN